VAAIRRLILKAALSIETRAHDPAMIGFPRVTSEGDRAELKDPPPHAHKPRRIGKDWRIKNCEYVMA
jgi:hypothetical protein